MSIFGAAPATAVALFHRFRSFVHNFVELSFILELENDEDSESDRASRLAKLRVARLYVSFFKLFQSL